MVLDRVFQGRDSYLQPYSPSFGGLDRDVIRETFRLTARRFRDRLLHLLDDLAAGRTDVQGFNRALPRIFRDGFGITFALGALSIDPFHTLTLRDIRVIEEEISQQKRFLRAFAKEIAGGFYVLDPVQRSSLYLQSLRGMFELGRIEALPSGPYEWQLNDTEHCLPCIQASLNGPYQRERYSGLGLPVIPGIPGSGDLCRGLTRCGCTIKLSGAPIPNVQLQQEIRDVLAEVIHDTS
jgi:hypothetical protein